MTDNPAPSYDDVCVAARMQAADTLLGAFCWDHTALGYDFWKCLYTALRRNKSPDFEPASKDQDICEALELLGTEARSLSSTSTDNADRYYWQAIYYICVWARLKNSEE